MSEKTDESRVVPDHEGRFAYSEALREVRLTLKRRSRNHRNLVITTVGIVFAGLAWSIACLCLQGVAVLGTAFPILSLLLLQDLRLMSLWRSRVIDQHRRNELDISMLRKLVSAAPDLPHSTVDSMLGSFAMPTHTDTLKGGPAIIEAEALAAVDEVTTSYWRTRLLGALIAGLYGAGCWAIIVLKEAWVFTAALGAIPMVMIAANGYAERRLTGPGGQA